MGEVRKRRVHSAEFKAKVAMEAVHGVKTLNEIGQQYGVHPVVVGQWRKQIVQHAAHLTIIKHSIPSSALELPLCCTGTLRSFHGWASASGQS